MCNGLPRELQPRPAAAVQNATENMEAGGGGFNRMTATMSELMTCEGEERKVAHRGLHHSIYELGELSPSTTEECCVPSSAVWNLFCLYCHANCLDFTSLCFEELHLLC